MEEVQVQVVNKLAAFFAAIDHYPVAGLIQVKSTGQIIGTTNHQIVESEIREQARLFVVARGFAALFFGWQSFLNS